MMTTKTMNIYITRCKSAKVAATSLQLFCILAGTIALSCLLISEWMLVYHRHDSFADDAHEYDSTPRSSPASDRNNPIKFSPVCDTMEALHAELEREDRSRDETRRNYLNWLHSGEMNCGKGWPRGPWYSSNFYSHKNYNDKDNDNKNTCAGSIMEAKSRLFSALGIICDIQKQQQQQRVLAKGVKGGFGGNKLGLHLKNSSQAHVADGDNLTPRKCANGSCISHGNHREQRTSGKSAKDERRTETRGVLFTGQSVHFRNIYQAIYAIRMRVPVSRSESEAGMSLPVEVWVNDYNMPLCRSIFVTGSAPEHVPGIVQCRGMPNSVTGYSSKLYAMLHTKFEEVLFLDSDQVPVGDVSALFKSNGYKRTGAVLWPDLWGLPCSERVLEKIRAGATAQPTHVMWKARVGGLQWDENDRRHAQEVESGQMVIDLTRHRAVVYIALMLCEDRAFFQHVLYGDKDAIRFAFLITKVPYRFVSHPPSYSLALHSYNGSGDSRSSNNNNNNNNNIINQRNSVGERVYIDSLIHYFPQQRASTEAQTHTSINRTHYWQAMFLHQNKQRRPNAVFYVVSLPPPQHRGSASAADPSLHPAFSSPSPSSYCLTRTSKYMVIPASLSSSLSSSSSSSSFLMEGTVKSKNDKDGVMIVNNNGQELFMNSLRNADQLSAFLTKLYDTVDSHWTEVDGFSEQSKVSATLWYLSFVFELWYSNRVQILRWCALLCSTSVVVCCFLLFFRCSSFASSETYVGKIAHERGQQKEKARAESEKIV